MATVELPAGVTWRRPRADDAAAIFDLVAARNTAVVGFADVTPADIEDELADPAFDLERGGWLVHDAEGRLLGWGWSLPKAGHAQVDVDVHWRDETVARWLLERVLERVAEHAAADGADARAHLGIYREDAAQQALATEHGFAPATSFHRMRIDHTGPRAEPAVPPGVTAVTGPGDEALRRAAHAVQQASFGQHFGFEPEPYDEWVRSLDASSAHDWGQLQVAFVDGEPAAVLVGNDQFVPDEDCGYVRTIGVVERFRGRGLARLLLERAFARDAAAGRAGTLLHVDTANTTPALDLYLSVGMRPVLVVDVWTRDVPASAAPSQR